MENIQIIEKAKKNNPVFGKFFEKLKDSDTEKLATVVSDKRFDVSEDKRTRVLLDCLRHEEFEVIQAAGTALGDLVDESHKWELIGLSMEERHGPSVWAAKLLGGIDDGSIVPVLFDIFDETGDFYVFNTIRKIANPSAIPKLEEYLGGDDEWLRMRAMQTLMEMQRPEANDIFVRSLNDSNLSVSCAAAMGLALVGTSTEVPEILEVFVERNARLPKTPRLPPNPFSTPNNGIGFGIHGMRRIEVERSDIPLGQPVSNIAHALGEIGDKRAVPALLEAAKTTHHDLVRAACVGALAKIGGVDYSFFIERLGAQFSDSVRTGAERGLRKIECLPELYTTYLGAEAQIRSRIKQIITRILASLKTPEDVAELFVHFDIALGRGEKIKTADDLSEIEIRLMNEGIYNAAVAAQKRLAKSEE